MGMQVQKSSLIMGKLTRFSIAVKDIYVPSASNTLTISGQVHISLTKDVKVNYLRLTLKGKSECHWSAGSGDDGRSRDSVDRLLHLSQTLLNPTNGPAVSLTAGNHTLPFTFYIVDCRRIASTFTGSSNGKITYKLKADLDRVGYLFDDKIKVPINICNPTSAEDVSRYMEPRYFEDELIDGCCCFATGPVIVKGTIPKSVINLRSGDTIDIEITIDNMRNNSLTPLAFITEKAKLKADGESRTKRREVCRVVGDRVAPHTRKNVVCLRLGPITAPLSGTIACTTNIFVDYFLTIKLSETSFKRVSPILVSVAREPVRHGMT